MVDQAVARLDAAEQARDETRLELRKHHKILQGRTLTAKIIRQVSQEMQIETHTRMARIVNRCLAVFPDPYEFHILFEVKRGKTEARLVFRRDGVEVDPLDGSGGGIVDVAAFALRVAALVLHEPPLRRILFLDEPFKFVAPEVRPVLAQVIEVLAQELGIQFVLVTHDSEFEVGKVVRLPDGEPQGPNRQAP